MLLKIYINTSREKHVTVEKQTAHIKISEMAEYSR